MLFLDPLCPDENSQVPILLQSDKAEPQSYHCCFCVETDIERFIDYIFSTKLRIYLHTAHSNLLYAQCELDLSEVLTSATLEDFYQLPIHACSQMSTELTGEPIAFLQFAAGTRCQPRVNPFNLGENAQVEFEPDDPMLKVVGKENLDLANPKIVNASGEQPTVQDYVLQTEAN